MSAGRATTFDVVITNYNYAAYVREAIESALAQTRAPRQVIVVDDGSTDDSAQLLTDSYGGDERVTLIFSPNRGQLSAFALGSARAEADVVCILDADDLWTPSYLEQIGRVYDANRDVHFVFSDLRRFGASEEIESFAAAEEDIGYTAIATYFTTAWFGASTSAISLRRNWALRCTDFPDHYKEIWRISADACVVYAASIYGAHKYFLPTDAVRYRVHGDNYWFAKWTKASDYRDELFKRCTVNYCARQIGLEANCGVYLDSEFATKPSPSAHETARYRMLKEQLAVAEAPQRDATLISEKILAELIAMTAELKAAREQSSAPAPVAPSRSPRRYFRDVFRVILQKPNL